MSAALKTPEPRRAGTRSEILIYSASNSRRRGSGFLLRALPALPGPRGCLMAAGCFITGDGFCRALHKSLREPRSVWNCVNTFSALYS